MKSLADIEKKLDSFRNLDSLSEALKGVDNLVTKDDLRLYVKWPALEEALNVKKRPVAVNNVVSMIDNNQDSHAVTMIDYNQDSHPDSRPHTVPEKSSNQTPVATPIPPKTAVCQSTQVSFVILFGTLVNHVGNENYRFILVSHVNQVSKSCTCQRFPGKDCYIYNYKYL